MIFRVRSLYNVQHRRCIVHLSSLSSNVVCDVSTNKGNGIPSDKLNYAAGEKLEYQNNTLSGPMNVLARMDQQGVRPSVNLYGSILKACAKRKALSHVKIVHAHLAKHGLELDRAVGEILVRTLVKCGDLEGAFQLFYRLPYRTVISWTAMISGYTLTGQSRKALRMFERMKGEGIEPNAFTIVSLLKACGTIADLEEGKRIHGEALRNRCDADLFVHSCLVDMYGRCGSLLDAQEVFDELTHPDVVTWTALLAAYVQQGQAEKPLELYEQMLEEGVSPDSRTFVVLLQACGMVAEMEAPVVVEGQLLRALSFKKGKEIHAETKRKGFNRGIFVGSSLIGMYGKCGNVADARSVFEALSERNVVCWTVMLTVYVEQNQSTEALKLFNQMQQEGVSPDVRTFASVIQACGKLAETELENVEDRLSNCAYKGKAIHARAWRMGYDQNVVVGSTLVDMYAKCGAILDAQIVFDRLPQPDVVAWTVLIMAYVEHGLGDRALCVYERMREVGVSPNAWTYVSALRACCRLAEMEDNVMLDEGFLKPKTLEKGKAIHAEASKESYDKDAFFANTLVVLYGKCGVISDAQNVFYMLSQRNVVAWTAMLAIYVENNFPEKAVQLYELMLSEGLIPDEVTIVWILHAYSTIGSLAMVRHIHRQFVSGQHGLSPVLAATLVTAYGKCASLVDAHAVFSEVCKPGVVLWTALIAGYVRQGQSMGSLRCYEDMLRAGVKPDEVTFLLLFTACSHASFTEQGLMYFESMSKDYGMPPKIEHFVSMIDLLGRAGCFSSLQDLLSAMPMQPTLTMWLCLLGACRKHGKVMLAEQAFHCAIQSQPDNPAAFILMSNIYADAGLFEQAAKLREQEIAVKKPGQSWIEHEQIVHTFLVQDHKHSQCRQLYNLLRYAGLNLKWEAHDLWDS